MRLDSVADGVRVGVAVAVVVAVPSLGEVWVSVAPGIGVFDGVMPGISVAVGIVGSTVDVGNKVAVAGGNCVPSGKLVLVAKGVMPMLG